MCTAATYKTKDFYFGRTLDYEFSYGEQVVITPRNYEFTWRDEKPAAKKCKYAMIGMAHLPRIHGINSNDATLSQEAFGS